MFNQKKISEISSQKIETINLYKIRLKERNLYLESGFQIIS